jgi:hypothetical protein
MATRRRAVACSFVLMLSAAGCAPNVPYLYKLADPKDRMVCREEVPIGSWIPKMRCFTLRQLDLEAEAVRRAVSAASEKSNNGRR